MQKKKEKKNQPTTGIQIDLMAKKKGKMQNKVDKQPNQLK